MDLSVITTRLRAGIRRLRPGVVAVAATALLTADAVGQTWTTEAFMPTPRIRHVAAGSYLNNGAGRVFVFAGDTGSTPYATVEAYDPVTNSWDPPSTYANIPTRGLSPCIAKGNLQSRSTATGSGTPNFVGMWPNFLGRHLLGRPDAADR